MNRLTQMTHEWLDTPVHELSDNTIMILKHELLTKVTQLNNELTDREEETGGQWHLTNCHTHPPTGGCDGL